MKRFWKTLIEDLKEHPIFMGYVTVVTMWIIISVIALVATWIRAII